jgi:methionine-rich copper-binding protein CopC
MEPHWARANRSGDLRRQVGAPRGTAALLACGLALLSVVWAGTGAAAAHAELVSSTPEAGARLGSPPSEVVLRFSDPMVRLGAQVQVSGPDGPVTSGDPEISGTTVRQALYPAAPVGRYRVLWRATSRDGHPVSGTFGFRVAAASPAGPSATVSGSGRTGATPSEAMPSEPSASDATSAGMAPGPDDPGSGGSSLALGVMAFGVGAGAVAIGGGLALATRRRAAAGHAAHPSD